MDPRCARVVALVDMDCFYVEVERRFNPKLVGVPVAVSRDSGAAVHAAVTVNCPTCKYEPASHCVCARCR